MSAGSVQASALERVSAELSRKEASLAGRLVNWAHFRLASIERSPFLPRFFRKRLFAQAKRDAVDLDSSFVFSLVIHLALFFALARLGSAVAVSREPEPLRVRLFETAPAAEKVPPARGAPRAAGRPLPPARPASPSQPARAASPEPAVSEQAELPAPKRLAAPGAEAPAALAGATVEQLVQLPTRAAGIGEVASESERGGAATGLTAADLLPGRLARAPAGRATAGGSSGGALGCGAYCEMIERRVRAAWRYPEGLVGSYTLYLRFVVDRSGNLLRVEVVEASEPRLRASAVEAMRRASPFPPVPEHLKHLAGQEIGIRFKVDLGLRGAP